MSIEKFEFGKPIAAIHKILIDGKPVPSGDIWLEDLERGEVHINLDGDNSGDNTPKPPQDDGGVLIEHLTFDPPKPRQWPDLGVITEAKYL